MDGFDFSNSLGIKGISKLEITKNLNIKVFELGFLQRTNNPKLLPIYVSQQLTKSPGRKIKPIDLIWHNNLGSSMEKLNVSLGNPHQDLCV